MEGIIREESFSQFTLGDIFKELKKRLLLVVAIICVFTAVGGVFGAFVVDTTYTSEAVMMVRAGEEGTLADAQTLASAFMSLAGPKNEQIYKKTVVEFNADHPQNKVTLKELKESISISTNSMLLNVAIETKNPKADSILIKFMLQVQEFAKTNDEKGEFKYPLFANKIDVISQPSEPESDEKSKVFKYLALFFIVGAFCSMVMVIARVMLDDTYTDKASFERDFEVSVLATFEEVSSSKNKDKSETLNLTGGEV